MFSNHALSTDRSESSARFNAPIRVLLADNYALVRDCARLLIEAQFGMEVIAQTANGRAAVQMAVELQPDVVVIGDTLSFVSSASAARQIKQKVPKAKLLFLTPHDDRQILREIWSAGASGLLPEHCAPDDLIRAIRTLASGGIYDSCGVSGDTDHAKQTNDAATHNSHAFDAASAASKGDAYIDGLSAREVCVLRRIAQGYSNKEVAAQLGLAVKTVETYKRSAMEKVGIGSRADLMRYAVRQGWLGEKGRHGAN